MYAISSVAVNVDTFVFLYIVSAIFIVAVNVDTFVFLCMVNNFAFLYMASAISGVAMNLSNLLCVFVHSVCHLQCSRESVNSV